MAVAHLNNRCPGAAVAGLPKMSPGHTYLVMIRPFEYAPGKPTGQFVVVGLDTIWQESDGTFRLLQAGADDPGGRYPATITPERLGELVTAAQ